MNADIKQKLINIAVIEEKDGDKQSIEYDSNFGLFYERKKQKGKSESLKKSEGSDDTDSEDIETYEEQKPKRRKSSSKNRKEKK